MTVVPAPLDAACLGVPEGLAGCPPVNRRFAPPILTPAKLEAQTVEGGFPRSDFRTERIYLRFLRRQLQPKLTQAFPEDIVETLRVFFPLEHPVVRLPSSLHLHCNKRTKSP